MDVCGQFAAQFRSIRFEINFYYSDYLTLTDLALGLQVKMRIVNICT